MPWASVRDSLARDTARRLALVRLRWGGHAVGSIEPVDFGPKPWFPDHPPDSAAEQYEIFGGIASVVVFYTEARAETVLVYHPSRQWEPPGGAVEAEQTLESAARTEAKEETGLEISLTDLLYTGTVRFHYDDGSVALLPLANFVGVRERGTLRVEREVNAHPGVTRGVGMFDRDALPENCRDWALIETLMDDETRE